MYLFCVLNNYTSFHNVVPTPTVCDGNQANTYDCCSSYNYLCGENEGDCDYDDNCLDHLLCGSDNCVNVLASDNFTSEHDCCFDPLSCDGTQTDTWDCCSSIDNLCKENEGDCDTDAECIGNLVCGTDNCVNMHSTHSFTPSHDCCFNSFITTEAFMTTTTAVGKQ